MNKKQIDDLTETNVQQGRTINKVKKELREILRVYRYESKEQVMSKDVATSLENLLGSLLRD